MAWRNPPPRPPRAVRLGAAAAVALGATVAVAPGGALGPPIVRAEPAPDLARARELYRSAEAAMQDGRYDDAARDYGAAYDLSADPALLYKIGHASERAGKCDVALLYYARYLREGKPTEQFTALTRERIAACGGDRAGSGSAGATGDTAGSADGAAATAGTGAKATGDATGQTSGASAGSAAGVSSSASPGPGASSVTGASSGASPGPGAAHGGAPSANAGSPPSGPSPGSTGGAAAPTGAPSAEGSASPERPAAGPMAGNSSTAALIPPTREKVAWLMGGGAIALVTLGGVLAYAASSSENDVRDLYAGFGGQTPMFDAQTRKRYDDLVDQGRSYQHLSWAAFGLAGAAAVGVAVLFAIGRGDEHAPPTPTVTPVIGPRGAGVSVRF